MTAPSDRRGFLRGLVSLPLIGGGVTLIGAPSAVAVPLSPQLLDSYDAWLEIERRFLKWERNRTPGLSDHGPGLRCVWYDDRRKQAFDWLPIDNNGGSWHRTDDPTKQPQPSSRAALVLSTVGCDWREGAL
ncbi:hypothetical protein [Methylobacterium sp. J-092]|uniref:hypothetical protein n=1 Tax=Methylobacterium sp. J-092 TaxID=2836667 RepID=UPI001FB93FCD|nr:hypothetical protein [Methylobacterium sp. J-092]MCJ2008205.1 hypothetical protein [Methylobacterium sp. J-092]